MNKEEYLEKLTGQIRCRLAREPIRKEMSAHIEDQMEMYLAEGMTAKEAEEAAVREMGNPVEAGEDLDKVHHPEMPWKLIGLIAVLSIAGFLMQYLLIEHGWIDFFRQFLYLLFGFGVMIAVCYADVSRIIHRAPVCFFGLSVCFMVGIRLYGVSIGGVYGISLLNKVTINTTMVVLLLIPLYAATLCKLKGKSYGAVLLAMGLLVLGCMPGFRCSSVSTIFVVFGVCAFLLTLAIAKGWFRVSKRRALLLLWGSVAAGMAILIPQLQAYQKTRLEMLFGLGEDVPYHMILLQKMLGGAQLIGEGSYRPQDHFEMSDYLLTHIMTEYGILAGVILLVLIAFLIGLLFYRSVRQKNQNSMMLGLACASVFLIQFVLYTLSNFGLLMISSYCPFLTYGGTGNLVTFLLFGIVLSIFRHEKVMVLYREMRSC